MHGYFLNNNLSIFRMCCEELSFVTNTFLIGRSTILQTTSEHRQMRVRDFLTRAAEQSRQEGLAEQLV